MDDRTKRTILLAVQHIGSGGDSERQAIDRISHLLHQAGTTWTKVIEQGLLGLEARRHPATDFGEGFGRTFKSSPPPGAPTPHAPAARTPPRPAPRLVQGAEVPERIAGAIRILDEREAKSGPMLTVEIQSMGVVYSPIAVFSPPDVAFIKAALERGDVIIAGTVRQPGNPSFNPVLSGVTA